MFIINSQSSISIANVINNWLDYMKSVTIFNFDKINLFADISFRFPYSSDMFLLEYRRQLEYGKRKEISANKFILSKLKIVTDFI